MKIRAIVILVALLALGATLDAALQNLGPGAFTPAATQITFSEAGRSVGDANPVYTFQNISGLGNVTVSFGGSFVGQTLTGTTVVTLANSKPSAPLRLAADSPTNIVTDSSNPTSPVLSGTPRFNGPVSVLFSVPVAAVGLEGGYFNAIGGTSIEAYDAQGNVLGRVTNTQLGIEFYGLKDSSGQNVIKGISFFITGNEPAGFAIDNLTFGALEQLTGPKITSISPSTITAGAASFPMTVNGSDFQSGATLIWKNAAGVESTLVTNFASSTRLTTTIPSSLVANAGQATVKVRNPDQSTSNEATFTITAPAVLPQLTSLSPNSSAAGSNGLLLTVFGANFVNGARVVWGGTTLATSFVSSTQLTASIASTLLATAGTVPVTVRNPDGQVSNAVNFSITSPLPAPRVDSFTPTIAFVGNPFTLTMNGSNFVNGARVYFRPPGGQDTALASTFISASQVSGNVPSSLLTTAGLAAIWVRNPDGQNSNVHGMTISPPGVPGVTIGVSGDVTVNPLDNRRIGLTLTSALASAVTGTMGLQFTHNAATPTPSDPDVKFISAGNPGAGGTATVPFQVPAGQTQAVFTPADVAIQSGTVAGTITSAVTSLSLAGAPVTVPSGLTTQLQVPRTAPRVTSLKLARSPSQTSTFQACVAGYSSPRDMTEARFSFSGSGSLNTPQLTATVNSQFGSWFGNSESQQYGSKFLYVQTFTIAGPDTAISQVTVTLRNSAGDSTSVSVPFSNFAASCN